jgi:hypothetical protein
MCWVLYLAADRQLSQRPFQPSSPGFNVSVPSGRETVVRKQFSKPHVYAVGAHTGCGCGFDRGQANPDHPEELQATEASLQALHGYLGEALELAGSLELFACWDGDQAAAPDHHVKLRLADFTTGMTWFPDRTFVEVTAGAA